MDALILSQLFIYPIKSLGGIEVSESLVLPKGLKFDRRWMLIDENNRFITQRSIPQMALIKTSLDKEKILIHFNDNTLILPQQPTGDEIVAELWDDVVDVVEVDEMLSKWFSNILDITCKLVSFPEEKIRNVDPDYAIQTDDQTNLADGYPILIIGQSSLDDLNSRLEIPVGIDRFRPNIVFKGGMPFEEDGWKRFTIGEVSMAGVKPCARCAIPTINQQTGVMGKEPSATLSNYRKIGNKVLFGQNVIPLQSGLISVGDKIVRI